MNKTEVKQTESKYAKKLKLRRRLSYQLKSYMRITRILTWPELNNIPVIKDKIIK